MTIEHPAQQKLTGEEP